jgi:hypothetical protein
VAFGVLGPLEVIDGGGARLMVDVGRERALLALLLVSASRVMPSERLGRSAFRPGSSGRAARRAWEPCAGVP